MSNIYQILESNLHRWYTQFEITCEWYIWYIPYLVVSIVTLPPSRHQCLKFWRHQYVWKFEDTNVWMFEDINVWKFEDINVWKFEDINVQKFRDIKMFGSPSCQLFPCQGLPPHLRSPSLATGISTFLTSSKYMLISVKVQNMLVKPWYYIYIYQRCEFW